MEIEKPPRSAGDTPACRDERWLVQIAAALPLRRELEAARAREIVPAEVAEVVSLEAVLRAAKNRDEIAAVGLRLALRHARVSALFVVDRELIVGLCGAGGGIESRLEGIMLPVGSESLLAEAVASGRMARGSAPFGALDQRLLRALGRAEARELAVLPIAIGSRVVNLLYVDNADEPLAETGLGALRVLCSAVARVYERLARERAARPDSPSAGGRRIGSE